MHTSKKTLRCGRKSALEGIKDQLLAWIDNLRHQGMAVSVNMVVVKACSLDEHFHNSRTFHAKYKAVRRLLKSNNFSIRAKTHEAQRPLFQVQEEARTFLNLMKPTLLTANRHPDFILNMDQTAVFFSLVRRTTVQRSGTRTVSVRTSTSSTNRLTLSISITASGKVLMPLIVYKGKCIET